MNHSNPERVQRALEPGTSVLIGTADARCVPASCRAIAVTSSDDLATATVYIPLSNSQQVVQNIATTKRIAVSATHPLDHCSVQIKGMATDVRLARDDEAALLKTRLDALADVLHKVGVPSRVVRGAAYWPAFAVTLRVEEIFEQTPGPKAGTRLR